MSDSLLTILLVGAWALILIVGLLIGSRHVDKRRAEQRERDMQARERTKQQ